MATLPGDEVLPRADPVMDRHLTLPGTPAQVWPWVEQLGKDRAGWYLPRTLERMLPRGRRATRRIQPRWLGLSVGDTVPDWGPGDPAFEVLEVEPPHHLVYWSERPRRSRGDGARPPLRCTWALVLTARGTRETDLHLRLRLDLGRPAGPVATYGGGAVDHLSVALMGRGLRERLEEQTARRAADRA